MGSHRNAHTGKSIITAIEDIKERDKQAVTQKQTDRLIDRLMDRHTKNVYMHIVHISHNL